MILLDTLKSHKSIGGDIIRGVRLYESGGIEFTQLDDTNYIAIVPIRNKESRKVTIEFTRDKRDIKGVKCYCTRRYKIAPLCCHTVAAILAIQGGLVDSPLALGKTATAKLVVDKEHTAQTVGSGSLPVFSTPMLIALMEKSACNCIADGLEEGETSVGTKIEVEHTAASLIGARIIAEARVEAIFGRRIEFTLTARDEKLDKQIGYGKHTRMIIDEEKFMNRLCDEYPVTHR